MVLSRLPTGGGGWRRSPGHVSWCIRARNPARVRSEPRHRGRRVHRAGGPVRLREDHGAPDGRRARMITEGTIDRRWVVNDVPPKDRDIAMVFQNYALYPHMTVYDNMAFGLKLRSPQGRDRPAVGEAAGILDIDELLERNPGSSRAARQRVAMGGRSSRTRRLSCWTSRSRTSTPSSASRAGRRSRDPEAAQRRHDVLRDPRPGRGDDDGRPGRGDAQGRAPAGRRATVPVRPPGEPVRRRLHRVTRR